MSSPARTLGPVPTASRVANVKKRILTDSEDTEERELKRGRPQDGVAGDQEKQRDLKDKKKRRKKKRKVSVVQATEGSDTDLPVLAPKTSITRVRSRSVASAGPAEVKPTPLPIAMEASIREPSAGPSASPPAAPLERIPTPPPKEEHEAAEIPAASTVDKGKARAAPDTSDPVSTSGAEEVAMLKEQVSTKANIITQHENLVSTLQQSLSCQICLDLMYKPFALSPCGHSACYPCLVNWFKAPPPDVPANEVGPPWLRKKTCPHCRTVIKERPIEIWAIKEMVASLAKSGLAQNLPSSESAEGTANADPWAGIFRPARGFHDVFPDDPYPVPLQQLMGLRDDEDGGIYRCVECHHEIWDGTCSQCGRVYPGHGYDHASDDDDDDDSMTELWRDEAEQAWAEEDEAVLPGYALQQLRDVFLGLHAHAHGALGGGFGISVEDDESLDPDWDDGGDTEIEIDSDSDDGHWRHPAPLPQVQPAHISEVEENEDEHGSEGDGYESSFIDDGDGYAIAQAIRRSLARPAHQPTIELSDDDELENDDDEDIRFVDFGARRAPVVGRGRGPLVIHSDDEDEPNPGNDHGGDHHDQRTVYELEDDRGSDYHSYRDHNDRSDGFDEDEDDDLADQVAAREYDMYGDDGSLPRGGGRSYSGSEEDDDYY
ncbi:hypothetical protein C8Q80DRAFT_1267725 [Daedaleopsis nitida]|nr:hypothetical protein C8Q80DRAFT_1267725 [Daedaleopsis nitida]